MHVCAHACVYTDRKKHREIKKHGTGWEMEMERKGDMETEGGRHTH